MLLLLTDIPGTISPRVLSKLTDKRCCYSPAKSPAIMARQLHAIADTVAHNTNISVHVIPFAADAHTGMAYGAFTLLDFAEDLPPILYPDLGVGQETLVDDHARLCAIKADVAVMLDHALSSDTTAAVIKQVANEMTLTPAPPEDERGQPAP
ncbi:Scr1 family TA system antitoxin-like transcriptional regulator [Nonomuraea sp. KM90]|uniref:Scr1 family TA system antitoxin-like transcriptional regulator n=1 Tax=Nonomuraea sp. KM90 TaxID=3457428 RepID=UPI003FCD6DBD